MMTDPLLEVRGLRKEFGSLLVVDSVDIDIPRRSLVSVIGPNGAGKTTFFNLLSGKLELDAGQIVLDGERIDGLEEHELARRGLSRSFQITNFYPNLTVYENIRLAVQSGRTSLLDHVRRHTRLTDVAERTEAVLDRVGLLGDAEREANTLAYGQQRHLELGIALGLDPELLLLDEPTAGMSPEGTREIKKLIRELSEELTLIMVEHDMDIVMEVSDIIAVMDRGTIIAEGSPSEVREDDRVQQVYLRRE